LECRAESHKELFKSFNHFVQFNRFAPIKPPPFFEVAKYVAFLPRDAGEEIKEGA